VLTIIRRLLRRHAETWPGVVADPTVSRAGQAVAGMRPGSTRHRPSAREQEFARRAGVDVYDPERRRT
jgi:hypothetical protein